MINFTPIAQSNTQPRGNIKFTPRDSSQISPQMVIAKQQMSPFNPKAANSQFIDPNKPQPGTTTASKFIGSIPKAVGQTLIGAPAKLATSLGEGIDTTVRTGGKQNASGKTYHTPVGDFNSFQSDALNRAKAGQGPVKNIAQGAFETGMAGLDTIGTGSLLSSGADKLAGLAAKVDAKTVSSIDNQATKTAIEAVNPELSGKKLTGAYKDIVTGNRTVSSGGILKTQDVGITKQTKELGASLKDLLTSKDPVKNLQNLAKGMKTTESQLTPLLENDKTPIIKQALTDTLEGLKTTAPREYIKDPNKTYQDVVDYAKQLVNNSNPTIKGGRISRILFDAQTKREFPSAFKEGGFIDTKTPAGQAIKDVRDTWNNYLYQTAEHGSEIQKLIGREADIFKATDSIAPKAAANQGLSKPTKVYNAIKKHPVAAGATAIGADKLLKHTTGIGF